jgi:hypothetical protein
MADAQAALDAELRNTQKERAVAEEELAQWERRVRLAQSRGEPLLKRTAEQKAAELKSFVARLVEEEERLKDRASRLGEREPA